MCLVQKILYKIIEILQENQNPKDPNQQDSEPTLNETLLDAISNLSAKMDRMALKTDLEEMQKSMEMKNKEAVAKAIDPIKSEICDLTERIKVLESECFGIKKGSTNADVNKYHRNNRTNAY